jgi:DNA-directed RNA polymerase subunit K/omega
MLSSVKENTKNLDGKKGGAKKDNDLFSVEGMDKEESDSDDNSDSENDSEEESDEDEDDDLDTVDDDGVAAKRIFAKTVFGDGNDDDQGEGDDDNEGLEEESDYGDEEYFQKIDNATRNDYVSSFHSQLQMPSNEEVQRLTAVQRNEKGVIDDPLHMTEPFVRKYEKTHIIGVRASQLENGAEPMIPVEDGMTEVAIATAEFERKILNQTLPFIVWRPFPNGGGEFWKLEDLEII